MNAATRRVERAHRMLGRLTIGKELHNEEAAIACFQAREALERMLAAFEEPADPDFAGRVRERLIEALIGWAAEQRRAELSLIPGGAS